eukprot:365520-Chlamydomonas_euryale.AAC.27
MDHGLVGPLSQQWCHGVVLPVQQQQQRAAAAAASGTAASHTKVEQLRLLPVRQLVKTVGEAARRVAAALVADRGAAAQRQEQRRYALHKAVHLLIAAREGW